MAPKAKPAAKAAAGAKASAPSKADAERRSVRSPSLSSPAGKRASNVLRSSGAAILAPSASPKTPEPKAAAEVKVDSRPGTAAEARTGAGTSAPSAAPPSHCSGCGAALKAGQPVYGCKAEGHFMCKECAEKSIAWQPEKCDLCGGPFASGMSVFKSPEDGKYACAKCAALHMAKVNNQLPSKCSACSAPFTDGSKYFESDTEGEFLCVACGEKKRGEQPTSCSSCKVSLLGRKAFKAPDGSGAALCEKCLEAAIPKCTACGEPASGSMAKLGGKMYHAACVKCVVCSERINGACAQSSRGLVCGACKENVGTQLQQMQKLLEAGDIVEAARLADSLRATGLVPPSVKLPELRCAMCSADIEGQCDQTANGLICLGCGKKVEEQVKKMKELFEAGDPMGAARVGMKLKEQGVTPPTIEMLKTGLPSLLRSAKYEQEGKVPNAK